jgi:PKD repeat protein
MSTDKVDKKKRKSEKKSESTDVKTRDVKKEKEEINRTTESRAPQSRNESEGSGKKILTILIVISIISLSAYAGILYLQKDDGDGDPPVEPTNEVPIANSGGDREILSLLPIQFNGNNSYDPDGSLVRYNWTFGDGSWSNELNPVHAYTQPGLFSLILTVEDDEGEIDHDSAFIRVLNREPMVFVEAPTELTVSQIAVFNGTAVDSDGFITLYEWDFDGNGEYEWYAKTTGKTNHFYSGVGDFTARFRVTDDQGDTNTTEITISVLPIPNHAPKADAGTDQRVGSDTVSLFGTGTDPDGNIIKYEWDLDGDGTFDWSSPTNQVLNHSYSAEGSYKPVFRVTDALGLYDDDSVNITIDFSLNTPRIAASINIQWNESTKNNPEFNYIINFNNSVIPTNLTVYIRSLPSGEIETMLFPTELVVINSTAVLAQSQITPDKTEHIVIEVFYFDSLIGQREIALYSDYQRQLLHPSFDTTVKYSYITDLYLTQGQTIREESHTGVLEVTQTNPLVQYWYSSSGSLKLTTQLQDSSSVFNLTSDTIYRNESWYAGILNQDSFEFSGTGKYKVTSSDGAYFDIDLDTFVLKEQNGNRTDYYFSGEGTYHDSSIDGTTEIDYILLGLDSHDNWAGTEYLCEKYKIVTQIEYEIENTTFKFFNSSFIWSVAEAGSFEDKIIFYDYYYFFSANDSVIEQQSGNFYPPNAPKKVDPTQDILSAIRFDGLMPLAFFKGDTTAITSDTGFIVKFNGISEGERIIDGQLYTTTDISGKVISGGSGFNSITAVNSDKYSGWILSKHEKYQWGSDRFERKLELII